MTEPSVRRLAALAALFVASAAALAGEPATNPERLAALRQEAQALEHGEGVPRNPDRAVELYCQGARLGDAEAQYRLGWIYANGRGVKRDDGLASYFFALAAQQGHEYATRMLRQVGDEAAPAPKCMVEVADDDGGEVLDLDNLPPEQRQIGELVSRLAPQFGVNPRLAFAVIRAESNFDPRAVSSKNAQGLMQLLPETAVRFQVRKPFDPEQNVRGGLAYLRWLLAYFQGDVTLTVAAYNAGEGTVNRFGGVPPFPETRDYVRRIRQIFRRQRHPFDPSAAEPSPELPRLSAPSM